MRKLMLLKYHLISLFKKITQKMNDDETLAIMLSLTILFFVGLIFYWSTYGTKGDKIVYYGLVIVYLGSMVSLVWNMGQNRKKLTGRILSPLSTLGFEIENREKYWGYKGTYRNYFMRIFYETNIGPYSSDELWIVLYYQAPISKSWSEIKSNLTAKYVDSRSSKAYWLHLYKIGINEIDITRWEEFNTIFSFKQVKKRVDFMVDLAEKEGLPAMYEKEVNELIEADPDNAPYGHSED